MLLRDHLARWLNGEPVPWRNIDTTAGEWLDACELHGVTELVSRQLHLRHECDWPGHVVQEITNRARLAVVSEQVRGRETASVLRALSGCGVRAVLLKGTALAYTVYDSPSLRPRADTDIIVFREQTGEVRRVLRELGYQATPYCDGERLFCQFELQRTDDLGVVHAFDVHWKISTQSMFADALTCGELVAESVPVPALGAAARAASTRHALLLACIHPAMHHRNEERLIWLLDVHLLASRLSAAEMESFAELAVAKRVAAVCARELARARAAFGTAVPSHVIHFLRAHAGGEPSAEYLDPSRRWHHELLSNLRGLPGWRSRLSLLREVLVPGAQYMKHAYGITGRWTGAAALPALYLHRGALGAWKVLTHLK